MSELQIKLLNEMSFKLKSFDKSKKSFDIYWNSASSLDTMPTGSMKFNNCFSLIVICARIINNLSENHLFCIVRSFRKIYWNNASLISKLFKYNKRIKTTFLYISQVANHQPLLELSCFFFFFAIAVLLALEDVAVYTQPVFEDPSNVTAIAGTNAQLQCKVHHLENYTVSLCKSVCSNAVTDCSNFYDWAFVIRNSEYKVIVFKESFKTKHVYLKIKKTHGSTDIISKNHI